ncbi:DUF4434 domain-containing protein [Pseudomonas cremoricolorata]|uniref:DUF4434 domain-containing protein n=1 Tax=Pseudomonas cremoricolorata TaxID=157783 RepID=UPI000400AA5B|nr:DUF4434 domain-containing protein [Pseudomonas cremoricolorata]
MAELERLPPIPTIKKDFAISHFPLRRRQLLSFLACAPLFAGLPGCTPPVGVQGSFLQLWKSHADLTPAQWRERLAAMAEMGCRTLTLQWVGLIGGEAAWMIPESLLRTVLDIAHDEGMQVQVGLPFDNAWWQALSAEPGEQAAFFDSSLVTTRQYLASAPWPQHRAFAGWYIPYELEQYHWATDDRQQRLAQWLQAMSRSVLQYSNRNAAISTYFSVLPTQGSLTQLWRVLLDAVPLLPMVQDGVGVAGLGNLLAIEPLLLELRRRRAPFEVVVELFEQLPAQNNDGSEFKARSADYPRVLRQLEWARSTGAEQVVAFALDPWALSDEPRARRLREEWLKR